MNEDKPGMINRLRSFIQRTVVKQAIHSVAWILAVFGFSFGLVLILAPAEVIVLSTFLLHFVFAPPHIWGITFILLSLWLGTALSRNLYMAPLALYGMTVLVGTWSVFTLPAILRGDGSATAAVAYSAITMITLVAGLSLEEESNAQTS